MDTPKPITREDMYLSRLATGTGSIPKPITRKEQYLYYLCMNGFGSGGGGGTLNYNDLFDKPQINGTTLQGNLTQEDIGIDTPQELPNPFPITFDGMLPKQSYDGSKAVNITFPDVEILNKTAGTPVGEIMAYMGVTAPPNYLICDGTEYQIADYPYLAQHFIDNFGSVNFFGGDGRDTFCVPDLCGEFLRGAGENSHISPYNVLQGNGADVGTHQDATNHVYINSKTASGISVYVAKPPADIVDYYYPDSKIATTGGRNAFVGKEDSYNDLGAGYTSRPTNTSVLYCIKAKPTFYLNAGQMYSYEERRVGTWVDGKPLYEKTVDFGSLPNTDTKEVLHGIDNIEDVWIYNGYCYRTSDKAAFLLTFPSYMGNNSWSFYCNKEKICNKTDADRTLYNAIVTLRYTKTTD